MSRPLHAVLLPPSAGEKMIAALASALDGSGPAILPLDPSLPAPALATAIEAFKPSAIQTMEGTTSIADAADPSSAVGVADDIAVVISTSGSTGVPKGVQLSAAALTSSASASLRRIGAGPDERWLCCLPTFHIAGIGVLVRSLLTGTEPVIAESVSPDVIAESGCSYVSLVPTQLRRLLDAGCASGPIKAVLLGGAAAPNGLLAEAKVTGWRVVTTYGMSETCGGCVYDGKPLDGASVAANAEGHIKIRGPMLFSGYRLQPALTAEVLDDGWFVTSDLGEVTAEGQVKLRGRADDVIISGGENIVPGEVEALIGASEGVADAVVVGVPDPEWGEAVTAFVIAADPGDPPDLAVVRSNVRRALSAHAAPKKLLLVSEFPLLPSGKPDRAALRDLGRR